MTPAYRVAIGGIFTECNQLGGMPIDISWFERYDLCRGDELLQHNSGVVGGMLQTLQKRRVSLLPLLYAGTCPGGALTSACYRQLKNELLNRLRATLPVDGLLLPLHGAATVEDVGDLEGDLLAAVRQIVGKNVPIVATLDLHAHVSAAMVRHADALLAWETYPHRDAFTTGVRGAQILLDTLDGRCRPTMAVAKVPVITGAINASTEGDDPFAEVMRFTKAREKEEGVLSTSLFLVHPYLDLPEMGSGGLVITDDDAEKAEALAREIAARYWEIRQTLEPEVHTPEEAIARGLEVEGGPVLLIETADCCGGGAAGDSVASLAALLTAGVNQPALVPVVDPEAAARCHRAGPGAEVELDLGHRCDPRWGQPLHVFGRVGKISDGKFNYSGGIFANIEGDMGPTAVLEIGAIQVLVTSFATYDWTDEQYRSLDLDPAAAKFVVVKNPMNYRMAYGDIARAIFILDTPGPTPATVRHVDYKQLQHPFFPADPDIVDFQPVIYHH